MDSNFKVKISADLSQLEKSLGDVKTLLGTVSTTAVSSGKAIKDSTDKASASVGNLNKTFQATNDNAGRARLAAFAFGQVIRDAGFFSQSFGLGLLAISNNIPILIDQLVLLTGISGAAGVAISLIGSALTAGLTAFAYYAQSLARDGKSVGQVFKDMALDSESSLGRLVDYLSKPPASTILNQLIGGVQSGFNEIKSIFNDIVAVAMDIWNRFGDDIKAASDTIFSYITETIKFQLGLALNIVKAIVALMSGDFSGLSNAVFNIFKGMANQLINIFSFIASRGTQIIGGLVGVFDKLKGEQIKAAGIGISQFANSLKFASTESKSADFNLKSWISTIDAVGPKSKKAAGDVDKLGTSLNKIFAQKDKDLFSGGGILLESDQIISDGMEIADMFDEIWVNGRSVAEINDLITESSPFNKIYFDLAAAKEMYKGVKEEMKEINAWGLAVVQTVGGDLVNAFTVMLETGKLSFGGVLKAIGDMIKKLIAAALAALVLVSILQVLGIGKGLDFKKVFGTLSGLNTSGGGGGGQTPFAEGGIVSGPTSALVGEYPGAKTNPEVIAPLDKLQNMIANTGGGQMSGVLETRISGNDLVILMNKATKNRNSYF